MKKSLLRWQQECLECWKSNQYRGIVNVVTGAGKTILAIGAIETLLADSRPIKIKIVVPKKFLLYQWHNALRDELDIPYEDIGFFSGAHKTAGSRKFMLYVINSARYSLTRHIVADISNGERVFLISDECHRYGSEENSKIFDFVQFIPDGAPFYTLGLSATPYVSNYGGVLVPALGNEIYRFDFYNALNADIISKFTVFNVCVYFNEEERAEYDDLSEKLGLALYKLTRMCPELRRTNGGKFYACLERIIKTGDDDASELARAVFYLSLRRKETVYLARARINCTVDLARQIGKAYRIIIFGERIDTAELIFRQLAELWPNEVGIYHSKLKGNTGQNTLRQFADSEIRVLVSCKTLDEGLNIAETDVGIVVSSTGSRRQRIQRLGRVLRKKRGGRTSIFYYLFVDDTSEENEMLQEITDSRMRGLVNSIDISYDETTGRFSNAYYEELIAAVLSDMRERQYAETKIAEFERNAELGLLTGGWLMPEQQCLKKIETASGKAEKNYHIAMLMLIRKRVKKLWYGGLFLL